MTEGHTRSHRGGVRQRIITWSFVPTAIILLTVALVIFYAYEQTTEEVVVQRNRELTRLSASQLAVGMGEYADVLEALARKPEMYRADPTQQTALLQDFSFRLSVFDAGVVVLDPRGIVGPGLPNRPEIRGEDWSSHSYFRTMLTSPGPRYSDIVPDGPGGEDVIVVAVPILGENGELQGALAGMFRVGATSVSAFYGDLVKMRVGETGRIYLLDGTGRVIHHEEQDLIGQNLTGDPVVDAALSGQTRAVRATGLQGEDVVAGYAPVPGTSWYLVALEEWSNVTASSRGYRRFLLILLALGVIVPTAVVMTGVRRITKPIQELSLAAQEVAGGNFGRRIEVRTGDELEELGIQFNRMSTELEASYHQLERRVEDRTRELATLNSLAAVASRSFDLGSILEDSLALTMAAVDMQAGGVFRIDDVTGSPVLEAHRGLSPQLFHEADDMAPSDWGEWLGTPDTAPSTHRVEDYPAGRLRAALEQQCIRSSVKVPLLAKGRMLGVMALGADEDRALNDEELSLLAAIGNQVGVALDNALLHAEAERSAAAAERSRLARDLHDAVSQTLFSATLIAEVLPRLWEKDPVQAQERLGELRKLTRGALAEMRTLLLELRPTALEEADLADLLRQLAEAAAGRSGVRVTVDAQPIPELDLEAKVALYRIAQEALNNVIKHSQAETAAVRLVVEADEVRLSVSDDGTGFDPAVVTSDHLGLGIMLERAEAVGAKLEIDTEPGEGTQILVTLAGRLGTDAPRPNGDRDDTARDGGDGGGHAAPGRTEDARR